MTKEQLLQSYRKVATWRNNNVSAKWGTTRNGAPVLFIQRKDRHTWWLLDNAILTSIANSLEAFDGNLQKAVESSLILSDIFSVPI